MRTANESRSSAVSLANDHAGFRAPLAFWNWALKYADFLWRTVFHHLPGVVIIPHRRAKIRSHKIRGQAGGNKTGCHRKSIAHF